MKRRTLAKLSAFVMCPLLAVATVAVMHLAVGVGCVLSAGLAALLCLPISRRYTPSGPNGKARLFLGAAAVALALHLLYLGLVSGR